MSDHVLAPAPRRAWLWLVAAVALAALGICLALGMGLGHRLWAGIAAAAILFIPGFALQSFFARPKDGDLAETVCLSVGLSLSLLPLLLAWMTWFGGHWSPLLAETLIPGCIALSIAVRLFRHVSFSDLSSVDLPTALPLMLVFAVTLALRLDNIRGTLMPAWSDSFQHVVVSKLIIESGRIPTNYGPLIGIDSFRYHFGFHTLVAFWAWLTGLAPHRAVLGMGQVVNALSPLTVYFFLAYGMRDRRAGVVGAVIVGLLTISPANHVNFGRYPQLTGQLLLPVVMALTLRTLWAEEEEPRPWLLAAVSAAGLCLVHYRVTMFYGCFVVANLLVLVWVHRRKPQKIRAILLEAGRLTAVGILLVAPWLVHLAQAALQHLARETAFASSDQYHNISWVFVETWSVPVTLIAWAALGAVYGIWHRARHVIVLGLWVVLLFLLSNPRLLRLPTTFVNNGAVVLALYLPAGMLGGYAASEALRGVARRWGGRVANLSLVAVVLVGSLVGVDTLNRRILEPWRFFVTPDDMQAYAWIRDNVPEDALFAVQACYDVTPLVMHGIDGGYWIPYTAQRRTILPPMPYAGELTLAEADPINRRAQDTMRLPKDHEALARLRSEGVTDVYVVEPKEGGLPGLWKPEEFAADPAYHLLYHQGTVWIFSLDGA